ncbi:MAG: TIGR00730 family Rossman fold protein [Okeania sp. SIO3B5]|uniref:LOG family protein n=1 Tax=Okeania sp. SIO3B5 TaxID=2607811 RepID=UPI0014000CF4|nr:TIGR00730 family Rossman fold protein [Okeania sp. SIO3B5]NEO56640.1 TIGR00730 family Rossman fold protein [Okeania sp. SIO3B5]
MNICVYCGSSAGTSEIIKRAAYQLGEELAKNGFGLVYGGANVGLMGAVADGSLSSGGQVYGVLPRELIKYEIVHKGLTELQITDSMHERKSEMEKKADAFVTLPGAVGTWEEFFEQLTWGQIGIHCKKVYLLNIDSYYDLLIAFIKKSFAMGFTQQATMDNLYICNDVSRVIQLLVEQRRKGGIKKNN